MAREFKPRCIADLGQPTWEQSVSIPVPNGVAQLKCTFRRRNRADLQQFAKALDSMSDAEAVLSVLDGWGLTDPCDAAHVEQLCSMYPGAGHAIVGVYVYEASGRRVRI